MPQIQLYLLDVYLLTIGLIPIGHQLGKGRIQGKRLKGEGESGRKSKRLEKRPTTRFGKSSEKKHRFSTLLRPKERATFETKIDNATNSTFNSPTANGKPQRGNKRILHMFLMVGKIVELGTDSPAIAPPTKNRNVFDNSLNIAIFKKLSVFIEPLFALSGRPSFTERGNTIKMLNRMIEVD